MEVVAAVFTDGDRVLACRRRAGLEAAGRWEFPGGKLEPGESCEAALEREIGEELDVEIEVGEVLDRSTTMVAGRPITLSCYFVRALAEGPGASTDHDQVCWFARDRLPWLVWAAPDLPAKGRTPREHRSERREPSVLFAAAGPRGPSVFLSRSHGRPDAGRDVPAFPSARDAK